MNIIFTPHRCLLSLPNSAQLPPCNLNTEEESKSQDMRQRVKKKKLSLRFMNMEIYSHWCHHCQICGSEWWEATDQRSECMSFEGSWFQLSHRMKNSHWGKWMSDYSAALHPLCHGGTELQESCSVGKNEKIICGFHQAVHTVDLLVYHVFMCVEVRLLDNQVKSKW